VFDKAAVFMAQGANGLVYGRNIYQQLKTQVPRCCTDQPNE
jgi:DhnA family fructose-bisphosphate aldolase class Ia